VHRDVSRTNTLRVAQATAVATSLLAHPVR